MLEIEEQRRHVISRNLRILMVLQDVGVSRIEAFWDMQRDLVRAKINGLVGISDAELISLAQLFETTPESFLMVPEGGFALPKNPAPEGWETLAFAILRNTKEGKKAPSSET